MEQTIQAGTVTAICISEKRGTQKKMCDRYHRDSSKEWETLCFRDLRLLRP